MKLSLLTSTHFTVQGELLYYLHHYNLFNVIQQFNIVQTLSSSEPFTLFIISNNNNHKI